MQALLISLGAVAIAEIGDKTQLLSLILAARYRKPWPIIAGIALATLLNHFLAAWFGSMVAQWLPPSVLKWLLVASFVAVALWALKPDRVDEAEAQRGTGYGAFLATSLAFFLAEIGDKTQVATIVLAAQYQPLWQVVAGTTLGMLLANVPVVFAGAKLADRIPMAWARRVAAALFVVLALLLALRPMP